MQYCNYFSLQKSIPKRFKLIHLLNAFIFDLFIPLPISKGAQDLKTIKNNYYLIRICRKKVTFLLKVSRILIE